MNLIYQSHDKFFKQSLKEKAIALDFFKAHLPSEVYQALDLRTLQATDKSYLKSNLSAMSSDIVYRCDIKGEKGYIPILILAEHQSTEDAHMAFRMLQYTLALMEDHLKAGHPKLPIVLPLCLYHGKASPFPYSCDIYDDFEDPYLARSLAFKPFHLIDLTTMPIESIQTHGTVAVMEALLQQSKEKQYLRTLQKLSQAGVMEWSFSQTSKGYSISTVSYILSQEEDKQSHTADQVIREFTSTLPHQKENIMNCLQQLEQRSIQQGMQKGMQQGIEQGMHQMKQEMAKNMLLAGLDEKTTHQITKLPKAEIKKLKEELL